MAEGFEPSDEQLVLLSKDGNLDAFNSLVERYQQPVFNLCYRLIGDFSAAEDAAQEAFLSAFRSINTFGTGSVRSWLLRIAANQSKDEMRRRRRREVASLDAPVGDDESTIDVADPAPGIEAVVELHEFGSAFQALLLELPFDQRRAVLLVDVFDFRYEEVAEMTGESMGTVKSRIHRGREKLRSLLLVHPELSATLRRLEK